MTVPRAMASPESSEALTGSSNKRFDLTLIAETGIADVSPHTKLYGRQAIVTLLINQNLSLLRGAMLLHADNHVLKNVKLLYGDSRSSWNKRLCLISRLLPLVGLLEKFLCSEKRLNPITRAIIRHPIRIILIKMLIPARKARYSEKS